MGQYALAVIALAVTGWSSFVNLSMALQRRHGVDDRIERLSDIEGMRRSGGDGIELSVRVNHALWSYIAPKTLRIATILLILGLILAWRD